MRNSRDQNVVLEGREDNLTCSSCNNIFTNVLQFLQHKTNHAVAMGDVPLYKCELCLVFYTQHADLISHYKNDHAIHNIVLTLSTVQDVPFESIQAEKNPITSKSTRLDEEKWETPMSAGLPHPECPIASPEELSVNPPHTHQFTSASCQLSGEQYTHSKQAIHNSIMQRQFQAQENNTAEIKANGISEAKNVISSGDHNVGSLHEVEDILDFLVLMRTEVNQGTSLKYCKGSLRCYYCLYQTIDEDSIKNHMAKSHPSKLSSRPLHLTEKDIQESQRPGQYATTMLTYKLKKNAERLQEHMDKRTKQEEQRQKKNTKQFACEKCGKQFSCLRYLRKHLALHRVEKQFNCDKCSKKFTSKEYLRLHKKNTHLKKDQVFKCSQCDFQSSLRVSIHAHRQIHPANCLQCDICGMAYSDRRTLVKHKRVHDMSRPFACNFKGCTWRFKTEMMCNGHRKAHLSEGKFKCNYCGYVFRQKHHLTRHEQKMHKSHLAAPTIANTESRINKDNILENTEMPPDFIFSDTQQTDSQIIDAQSSLLSTEAINFLAPDPITTTESQNIMSTNHVETAVLYEDLGTTSSYESLQKAVKDGNIKIYLPHFGKILTQD